MMDEYKYIYLVINGDALDESGNLIYLSSYKAAKLYGLDPNRNNVKLIDEGDNKVDSKLLHSTIFLYPRMDNNYDLSKGLSYLDFTTINNSNILTQISDVIEGTPLYNYKHFDYVQQLVASISYNILNEKCTDNIILYLSNLIYYQVNNY